MLRITFLLSCLLFFVHGGYAQSFTPDVSKFIKVKAAVVALTGAKLIDGSGRPAVANQTIIIKNGRIDQTGNTGSVPIPSGAQVIDCSGKTVIPGLVMLHEHLYYTMFLDKFFNIAEMPATFAKLYLAGGATTIRTAGSIEPQTDLAIKRMIGEGKLAGPDMDVTAPYIERAGFDIPALNTIKDSAEAAATVAFWAAKGCTSFKMYMHAKREDLVAVVREAHKRGMKVTGHLCTITYREAASLGIDNLEHGFMASSDFDAAKVADAFDYPAANAALKALPVNSASMKDLIGFLINKKVALTSTLPVFEPFTNREVVLGGGEEALLPQLREVVAKRWENGVQKDSANAALFKKEMIWEKQFYDAGGLLTAGTDPTGSGRTIAGYGSRREIELLVEAGFTPVQAIKIASLNGAIYLGKDKEIGTVEKGKAADLVVVNGDLEKDIRNIRKTEIVFKKGVGFDAALLFDSVKGKVGVE